MCSVCRADPCMCVHAHAAGTPAPARPARACSATLPRCVRTGLHHSPPLPQLGPCSARLGGSTPRKAGGMGRESLGPPPGPRDPAVGPGRAPGGGEPIVLGVGGQLDPEVMVPETGLPSTCCPSRSPVPPAWLAMLGAGPRDGAPHPAPEVPLAAPLNNGKCPSQEEGGPKAGSWPGPGGRLTTVPLRSGPLFGAPVCPGSCRTCGLMPACPSADPRGWGRSPSGVQRCGLRAGLGPRLSDRRARSGSSHAAHGTARCLLSASPMETGGRHA